MYKKGLKIYFITFLTLFLTNVLSAQDGEYTPGDSLYIKQIDGITYQVIVHRIGEKENLTQISKRYGVSSEDILAANPSVIDPDHIKKGHPLHIPIRVVGSSANQNQGGTNLEDFEQVKHQVQAKETLYGISKKYNISVEDIKKWNNIPDDDNKIQLGQELIVGIGNRKSSNKNNSNKSQYQATRTLKESGELAQHEVQPKETLYGISQKYGVSIKDLMEWNNFDENSPLLVGQKLYLQNPTTEQTENNLATENITSKTHEVQPKETLYSISKKYNITVEQLQEWNNIEKPEDLKVGTKVFVENPSATSIEDTQSVGVVHTVKKGENLTQIAKKYNLSVNQLKVWNNLASEEVKAGQEISLEPNLPTGIVAVPYVVEDKDNLFQISEKFEVPIKSITDANMIEDQKILRGQTLFIPVSLGKLNTEQGYKQKIQDYSIQDIAKNGVPYDPTAGANTTNDDKQINNNGYRVVTRPNTSGTNKEHIIDQGENLQTIATMYGITEEDILLANPNIPHQDSIKFGQKVIIPGKSLVPKTQDSYPNGRVHVIKSGENLGKIADQYPGVTVKDIMAHNNLTNPNDIVRGKAIIIPPPNHPQGQPIDMNKVADVDYAKAITKNDKNPYLKDEYTKYLLPEGEDAMHDLARDYQTNGSESQNSGFPQLDNPGYGEGEDPQQNQQQAIPIPQSNNNSNTEQQNQGTVPMRGANNTEIQQDDEMAMFTQMGNSQETGSLDMQAEDLKTNPTEVQPETNQETQENTTATSNSITTNQTIQQGLAEKMPIDGIDKNVCMHPFAKPGTVIQIKNMDKPNEVPLYLRVVENYQAEEGAKTIIKVSDAAYRQLNPGVEENQAFPVEIRIMN